MTESTLKEKIESAEKGSQELDALILCALLAPEGSKVEMSPWNGAWCIYAPRPYGRDRFAAWEKGPYGRDTEVSTSLDTALALVERLLPGWVIEHMGDDASGYIGALSPFGCAVELTNGKHIAQGQAKTRPLAVLSAILTALKDKDHV